MRMTRSISLFSATATALRRPMTTITHTIEPRVCAIASVLAVMSLTQSQSKFVDFRQCNMLYLLVAAQLAYLFTVLSAQHDHLRASAVALNRDGRKAEALAALTSSKQIAALRARLVDAGGGGSSATRASQTSAKLELEAFLATLAPLPAALIPARPASPPPTIRAAVRPTPSVSSAISIAAETDNQPEVEPSDEEVERAMREMELGIGAARPIVAASAPRPAPLPPQSRESPLKPPVRAVAPAASKAAPVAIDNSFQREIEEERVFERLRRQVEQLGAEAVAALARQQKELALVIMRRKKASERDRDEARSLLDAGERLPAHRVDRIAFEREVVLPDVSADDVQLRIERVVFREAAAKQGYTPYVVAKFTETAQADEIASGVVPCLADVSSPFETKTEHANPAAGGVAQFPNHVANMRLPRKDPKIGKRVATSCRFVFEVWHRRVLWSHLSLGTAEVRLKDLAAHCATTQVVAVRDAQKTTVGDLHVTIRVQTPLVSKQVEKVVIDCISFAAAAAATVDSTSVSSPAPMAAATAMTASVSASAAVSAAPLQVNSAAPATASSSSASAKVPTVAAVIPAASALPPNPEWPLVTESDIADPMRCEWIVVTVCIFFSHLTARYVLDLIIPVC